MTAVVSEHLEPDEIFSLALRDETHEHLAVCPSCADQHARALALLSGPARRQSPIAVPPVVGTGQGNGDRGTADERRNPLVIALGVGAAVALLALVGWVLMGRDGGPGAADGSAGTGPDASQPDAGSGDAAGQPDRAPSDRVRLKGVGGVTYAARITWPDDGRMAVVLAKDLTDVSKVWISHDNVETPLEPTENRSTWIGQAVDGGVLHVETAAVDPVTQQPATYAGSFDKDAEPEPQVEPSPETVP